MLINLYHSTLFYRYHPDFTVGSLTPFKLFICVKKLLTLAKALCYNAGIVKKIQKSVTSK